MHTARYRYINRLNKVFLEKIYLGLAKRQKICKYRFETWDKKLKITVKPIKVSKINEAQESQMLYSNCDSNKKLGFLRRARHCQKLPCSGCAEGA